MPVPHFWVRPKGNMIDDVISAGKVSNAEFLAKELIYSPHTTTG